MAKTVMHTAGEVQAAVPGIRSEEAQRDDGCDPDMAICPGLWWGR